MIEFLATDSGRWIRLIAGLVMVVGGVLYATTAGLVIALLGLIPIAAAAMDLCLLAPLVGKPMHGEEIRAHQHRHS